MTHTTIRNRHDVRALLEHTAGELSPNQRIVVMLYAASDTTHDGVVLVQASALARTAGMAPSVFSRTRKELVKLGWLQEAGSVGRNKLYRLDPERSDWNGPDLPREERPGTAHLQVVV